MKFLIVGLGNIGPEYHETRHNIGFMALDKLAKEHNLSWKQDRHVFKTEYKFKGKAIHLIKPTTYMNISGKAVRYWMNELKIPIDNVMIITDDLALPFEKLRLKGKGSSGGHNGLKDIEALLQTSKYPRLRMGVGDDFSKGRQVDFVLGKFSTQEKEAMTFVFENAIDYIQSFASIGLERTMNFLNKK